MEAFMCRHCCPDGTSAYLCVVGVKGQTCQHKREGSEIPSSRSTNIEADKPLKYWSALNLNLEL